MAFDKLIRKKADKHPLKTPTKEDMKVHLVKNLILLVSKKYDNNFLK
ncbi:protein of unknown function [Tepidibacter aestuarii]|nr:protein of unknown function [Tepidibacter aestuarii]